MNALLDFHVIVSLVGLAAGFVVAYGMWANARMDGWTAVFLATTVATCVTGFPLPADRVLPSHIVGVLTLIALGVAIVARYRRHFAGRARWAYVVGSLVALYFNAFVGVVQAFLHVPALHALAPTQGEPPFAMAQGLLLVLFVILGVACVRRFHPLR